MTPAEEEIAFYYELGRALSAWTNIEARLLDALLRCVPEGIPRHSIGLGFVNLQGFRNKLLFAGASIRRTLAGTGHTEEWDDVEEKLFAASGKRNDLAHFQTRQFPESTEGRRIAVCPWHAKKKRDKTKPPPNSYCVLDLEIMRLGFVALDKRLANFVAHACTEEEPFPGFDGQPDSPPTIQQIARRIHAELGHPQLSSKEKRLAESALNAAASLERIPERDEPNGKPFKTHDT